MPTKRTPKVYIENLNNYQTNFTSDAGSFKLKAYGFDESIAQIDEDLADEPFVQRAISRGKLRILTKSEATARILDLVPEASSHEEIEQYLQVGADHLTDHFKKDLPEDAFPTGPGRSAEDILRGKRTSALGTIKSGAKRESASEKGGQALHSDRLPSLDNETLEQMSRMGSSSEE